LLLLVCVVAVRVDVMRVPGRSGLRHSTVASASAAAAAVAVCVAVGWSVTRVARVPLRPAEQRGAQIRRRD
jgi:hypothetical protein